MRVGPCGVGVCLFFFCCARLVAQSTDSGPTLVEELSNNTSACSSATDPGGNRPYCAAFFNGFTGNAQDIGAETRMPDSPAGHVSNLTIKQLMYPGWNGRVICEYQPWFGASNHKSVGYNQNSASTVAAQDNFMLAVGCDINLIDFYGALDSGQSFNLAAANAVFSDLSTRAGYPLKFGIMEDKGALTSTCPPSSQDETGTVSCLKNALSLEMDYINGHYATSGVYFTDGGNPVVFSFVTPSVWPVLTSADWDEIWSALKAHTDLYSAPFKYVFEFGSFTSAPYDNGRYAWMQPPAYDQSQQFWWGSVTSSAPAYLERLYSAGLLHPSQLTVGGLWKGFDDNNASWSGNRVIAQQCGQVLLKTAAEMAAYFGGSSPQIPYVQVATWNDYEEGTAVEPGIDNCYRVEASVSGSQLSWSLLATDAYASPSTVDHFNVYYADAQGNLHAAASGMAPATRSLNLSSLIPPGTWAVYVEMVPKALMINRMSNGVSFTAEATGVRPGVRFTPAALTFPAQALATTSAGEAVTLTNTGTGSLNLSAITANGDFSLARNACAGSVGPGASCSFTVVFTPTAAGPRSGSVLVTSNAPGATPLNLTGSGADFGMNVAPGSETVAAGTSARYLISMPSIGAAFTSPIQLACKGLPQHATCSFGPETQSPDASTLTVATEASQTALARFRARPGGSRRLAESLGAAGIGLLGFAVLSAGAGKTGRRRRSSLRALAALSALGFCWGCGGKLNRPAAATSGTPAGSYNITVTGSSGALAHDVSLTLVVR